MNEKRWPPAYHVTLQEGMHFDVYSVKQTGKDDYYVVQESEYEGPVTHTGKIRRKDRVWVSVGECSLIQKHIPVIGRQIDSVEALKK